MMKNAHIAVLGGIFAAAVSSAAQAQQQSEAQQPYALHEMNFDMWCQEEQHIAPDRCDKRLPVDDAAFQSYRANIEKYEIPYLQKKQNEQNLNRVILHNDPVDHPNTPSTPQADTPSEQESGSAQH